MNLLPSVATRLLRGVGLAEDDLEGDAGHHFVVEKNVDGVLAGLIEFELLDVDDEIADEKICVAGD